MRRIHAFEFGDLTWYPDNLRSYATDYLQFASDTLRIYACVISVIKKGIGCTANTTIVDIASGGGGGFVKIAADLKTSIPFLKVILTDYYPNIDAFKKTKSAQPGIFEYVEAPVNAMDVPKHLKGFRTHFNVLHHFRPKDAKAILQNALDSNQAIGIFEAQQRSINNIVRMLLSPVAVLLMTPFIKPFKPDRIFFTYLLPVLPLVILWDGIISVLRTYTVTELKNMIAELSNKERFNWEVDIAKGKKNGILYLLGTPGK